MMVYRRPKYVQKRLCFCCFKNKFLNFLRDTDISPVLFKVGPSFENYFLLILLPFQNACLCTYPRYIFSSFPVVLYFLFLFLSFCLFYLSLSDKYSFFPCFYLLHSIILQYMYHLKLY